MKNIAGVFLLVLIDALLSQSIFAGGAKMSSQSTRSTVVQQTGEVVPGVVVVKFKRGYSLPEGALQQSTGVLPEAMREQGVVSLSRTFRSVRPLNDADVANGMIDLSQIHFASISPELDPRDVASKLAQLPQVEYAEPKYVNYLCDVPNDSAYAGNQQKYFNLMNAPAGWAIAKGSASVIIATVDGGTNWQHPDLKPNLWINGPEDLNHDGIFEPFVPFPAGDDNGIDDDHNGFIDDVIGWNFGNNSNDPRGSTTVMADHGTGTASASGAATNNGAGMAGSSWNCRVMPICAAAPNSGMITYGYEGIQYAYQNGAKVINCSWGRSGQHSQYEQDVITAATQAGALVITGAGDSNINTDESPFYPAAYDNVLSVGATLDTSDVKASFSSYGVNVSVFAPGVNIWIALDNGSYGLGQGTSFSAPLVAGLAGILKSVHPGWTPSQIAGQIRMTADPIDAVNPDLAGSLGHGRVNFGRALTETHASIQVVSSGLHTSTGRTFILTGDTLILSAAVKNTQGSTAPGLVFTVRSTDPALQLLQGSATIARLDSGQEVTLPDFKFKVGSLSSERIVIVKLEWIYNATETDAHSFSAPAFAATGFWENQTTLTSSYFYSVKAVNSNVAWAAGGRLPAPYSPLAVRTTDGGTTWADVTGNLPTPGPAPGGQWDNRLCITAIDADRAWIANWDGSIYATTNGGSSWVQQPYPGEQCWTMDGIWFFDARFGYALGESGWWGMGGGGMWAVLKTSDGGTSWAHLPSEPVGLDNEFGKGNLFSSIDPDHIWFGTTNGKVWRTTDAGSSWSYATVDGIGSVSFRDNSTGLAMSNGIIRSMDGGVTWTLIGSPVDAYGPLCYAPGSRSAWVINHAAAYRLDGDGSTWSHQPTSRFIGYVEQISFADSNDGWFVTNAGAILRYIPTGITSVSQHSPPRLPESLALSQNYPNPFNPSTTIKFELPRASEVNLTMFDILGREVSVLVNDRRNPGVYQVKFSGSNLASGVYFYRLSAGNFVQTRKLLLLR